MLKLVLGRSGTGKSDALLREIAAGEAARRQLLIVPEQHSHTMERQLCAVGGDDACRNAEVLSFTRLASRVFSGIGGVAHPTLDGGGRMLLMYAALSSVSEELKVYARPSRRPEFLTGLLATVDELKSCCVSHEALREAGETLGGREGEKLQDLSLIYAAYEAMTARQGADPRDRLTRLAEGLKRSRWGAGMEFYLDGFTDFTPQELLVIRELLDQGESVTVALTCDGLGEGEAIFAPARHTARRLIRLAGEEGVAWEAQVLTGYAVRRTSALERVERDFFAPEAEPWEGPAAEVVLFEAQSPESEAEWAAAEILRLVREKGLRFRDVAVTARSMEGYRAVIETVFPRYRVPAFQSAMTDVLQKPILALITAALESAAGDYAYEDLFRYLKTGLTGISLGECDALENYALKWQLRGREWRQEKPWSRHPRGYALPWTQEDRARVEELDGLRRRVIAPLERLRRNKDCTGRGQAICLYRFLEEIGLYDRLEERTAVLQERGDAALAEEYAQLWEILCSALEQCAQTLGDKPMELDEFARLLALVLSQYDVGAIPVSLDRVMVGEMPRLAHRRYKALLVLGAEEGAIPQVSASPGLLSDDDRSLLASCGLELAPSLLDRLEREDTILYEALSLPTDYLAVSWPTRREGEDKRPARAVARLRELLPGATRLREGELRGSFRLSAPAPALALALHRPEVRSALEGVEGYGERLLRLEKGAAETRGSLQKDTVELLYGKRVPMSASRMDRYKSCHFSYFMEYGLRAQPREPALFKAPEYGTFVHYVLQQVLQSEGWRPGMDRKALRALTDEMVERYTAEELGGLENESARFRYLFQRLRKTVYAVVENVTEELERSDFRPIAFELGFGRRGDLPPVEVRWGDVTVSISGFVDRVDGWEHDGRLYLRVVDYKTGRKSFDLTDIWNGLGLQMLLYLFTLKEEGRDLFGGGEIVPAGVLYLPARETVISGSGGMSEEERRRAADRELRRKGLVLEDPAVLDAMERPDGKGLRFLPVTLSARTGEITGEALVSAERLGRLEKHIHRILTEICRELSAGNISADPYWRGERQNACQYCLYADACHFEEGKGDLRRWLPKVKPEDFWAGLDKDTDEGGEEA